MTTVVTGLLMAVAVAGAVLAISLRNILHAIFGLAISLLGVAGLFVVLGSPFVATMEVIIYVGGISVAMIFAVMLSTVVSARGSASLRRKLMAAVTALLVFGALAGLLTATSFTVPGEPPPPEAWSVQAVGTDLLDRFNVAFESLSVILLLAIVGAIAISRRVPAAKKETA